MRLLFATGNKHKFKEAKSILPASLQLLSLNDINCTDELPESSSTFEGNARQKARYIADKYGMECFADDSGLEVEALNGSPGVYSARYAGTMNSMDNMQKLLNELKSEKNRRAQFRTVIACILEGEQITFEGIIEGTITYELRGSMGFGYDPLFMPNGYLLTFAEMNPQQKNIISHRALALQKFSAYLSASSLLK